MHHHHLPLSSKLTEIVNESFDAGTMLELVSPTTRELLLFWFDPAYCDQRMINFHEGQRQAILNAIYAHEVLGVTSVRDMYMKVDPELILDDDIGVEYIGNNRYSFPRYCMKMATGTGKTWVLDALLIWQYLNARAGTPRFSKNFLIVAPWLIVYERLLDSVLGKKMYPENGNEYRDFQTSDYYGYRELFIPDNSRDIMFRFIQNSTIEREDIGRKVTGDGQIIITNWHIFLEREWSDDYIIDGQTDFWSDPMSVARSILPISPGMSAGNSLESLDKRWIGGARYDYIRSIKDLVVFNDEAHHLGENSSKWDLEEDKKWQQAMNDISEGKALFVQIDFSATPYIQKGKTKKFFPHIIVDFNLLTAIKQGYVKTLVLDQRKEIATLKDLDYNSVRDENGVVIWLSTGQKIMIAAGVSKLQILEDAFLKIDSTKYPKMLIVCEDTMVIPFVNEFLVEKGYAENEDFIEIHSNKKWEIGDIEWKDLKKRLFALDKNNKPKIVISVLMLREGFDVNNICVIVPLRSSASSILLEQTIGRGLRLMWRDPDYTSSKEENRKNLLIYKKNPVNYLDILSIIEHPAYREFYNELLEGNIGIDDGDGKEGDEGILWDLEVVGLKDEYTEYDIVFPVILRDTEEVLRDPVYQVQHLAPFGNTFEEIKKLVPKSEQFVSEAVVSGTRFGDYDVQEGIMSAKSYNDFIMKLIGRIKKSTSTEMNKKGFGGNNFPMMQANMPKLAQTIDGYLRTRLWQETVDYLTDENWRVLMLPDVASFIIKEVIRVIYEEAQNHQSSGSIEIVERRLSEVSSIRVRTSHEVAIVKCIYPRLGYPSNRGGLEKAMIEYLDSDASVEAFCRIQEYKHDFLQFRYIRSDGIPASYSPDFIVQTSEIIYLIETKATRDMTQENVLRKEKSVLYALSRINLLSPEYRSHRKWEYVLLSEERFYNYRDNGANIIEMCRTVKMREFTGSLFE
jgi:type III restriction enzyme